MTRVFVLFCVFFVTLVSNSSQIIALRLLKIACTTIATRLRKLTPAPVSRVRGQVVLTHAPAAVANKLSNHKLKPLSH